jgi:hypothetical protein
VNFRFSIFGFRFERKRLRFCAPLLACLAAAGCIGPQMPIEAPASVKELLAGAFGTFSEYRKPVITSKRHPVPRFVTIEKGPEASVFQISPLLRWEDYESRKRLQVLWPWLTYRERGDNWSLWILPFFHASEVVREGPEGGRISDFDWVLFPLLWYGSETGVGSYFGVFPLGGKLRDFFLKDEVIFALFPLYMYTHDKAYDAHHFMWPLFAWWDGPKHHGWRALPFYSEDIREGQYERRSVLWPFFSWWRFGLDTSNPGSGWQLFPFAGHIHNKTYDEWMALMLFNWSRDEEKDRVDVHAPWPFFYYADGDNISAFKIWPLLGTKDIWEEDYRAHHEFVLWPFYQRSKIRTKEYELDWRSWMLLYWGWNETWDDFTPKDGPVVRRAPGMKEGGIRRTQSFHKVWPFVHVRERWWGQTEVQIPSLMPLGQWKDFETFYGPVYTIFRYEDDGRGTEYYDALLGLVHVADGERHTRVQVAWSVFDYESIYPAPPEDEAPALEEIGAAGDEGPAAPEEEREEPEALDARFTFLWGLFEYRGWPDGSRVRLFWIPMGDDLPEDPDLLYAVETPRGARIAPWRPGEMY